MIEAVYFSETLVNKSDIFTNSCSEVRKHKSLLKRLLTPAKYCFDYTLNGGVGEAAALSRRSVALEQ
jgi:hypothetical protein